MDGKLVVPDGREAPTFPWEFSCKVCGYVVELDAYRGPYSCRSHTAPYPFLVPLPASEEQMRAWMLAHYKPWANDHRGERKR